ncbi:hypothetical protein HJG60_011427 [Phyllostomus discolor]|uniref:Uncharacterized protein n=1 Tax=Phyllostomus discolor TaxID=89673 RepID=A0A833ZXT3_9CHIR|nr:hypothetical protein HJG60_011427 [Phyllostomus discolor]
MDGGQQGEGNTFEDTAQTCGFCREARGPACSGRWSLRSRVGVAALPPQTTVPRPVLAGGRGPRDPTGNKWGCRRVLQRPICDAAGGLKESLTSDSHLPVGRPATCHGQTVGSVSGRNSSTFLRVYVNKSEDLLLPRARSQLPQTTRGPPPASWVHLGLRRG